MHEWKILPNDPRLDDLTPNAIIYMHKYIEYKRIQEYNTRDRYLDAMTARFSPELWHEYSSKIIKDTDERIADRERLFDGAQEDYVPPDQLAANADTYMDDNLKSTLDEIKQRESAINIK